MTDLFSDDAATLSAAMGAGEFSAVELTRALLERIARHDGDVEGRAGINAFVELDATALEQAAVADAERRAGRVRSPLHGIPIAVKDNYDMAGVVSAASSSALAGRRPRFDATQVARLRQAGAVVIGRTNMDELASGAIGLSSRGGQTRNPYDRDRVPGGSSAGTGAAVAAGFAVLGLGSDTGGSIRIPAAHCGLAGIRTTLGLTSRAGIVPESFSQDIGGPLARTVRDLALVLNATAVPGPDAADASTLVPVRAVPADYTAGLGESALAGARIGVLTDLFGTGERTTEVNALIRAATGDLARCGAEVVELPANGELMAAMAAAPVLDLEFRRDFDAFLQDVPTLAGSDFARSLDEVIATGLPVPPVMRWLTVRAALARQADHGALYEAALAARRRTAALLDLVFVRQRLDAVVYPCQQTPPALIGQTPTGYESSALSSMTGWPALTVPAGMTAAGLPVGIEFLGRRWSEPALLSYGHAYEQATGHRRAPAL